MLKKLSIIITIFYGMLANSAQVKETSSHVYIIKPFHEMGLDDRDRILNASTEILIGELEDVFPEGEMSAQAIRILKENSHDISNTISDLNEYVYENTRDHEVLQSIFSARDTIPSAFMILAGGRFTVNIKIGGGGSAMFAVVVVPSLITKINKITQETQEFYSLRCGIVVFPVLDVGGGFGAGASIRGGFGLVWGELDDPEEFYGATLGISGTASFGVGNNLKAGTLLGLSGIKNIYATGTWQSGAVAEISAHVNIGAIVPIQEFLKMIDAATFEEIMPEKALTP